MPFKIVPAVKESYYINDDNIIWILNGDLRQGILKKIIYENNEIKYYFCNDNLYDLKLISSKHKIYIDNGYNQIIEILPENISLIIEEKPEQKDKTFEYYQKYLTLYNELDMFRKRQLRINTQRNFCLDTTDA